MCVMERGRERQRASKQERVSARFHNEWGFLELQLVHITFVCIQFVSMCEDVVQRGAAEECIVSFNAKCQSSSRFSSTHQ